MLTMKKKLGIINSDPKECTYGGVAPIMRNMHPYLNEAFDLTYYYIPSSWEKFPLPGRIKMMIYILCNFNEIKKNDFILSHIPEGSFLVSFMKKPFAHIFHGNSNPMSVSKYWYGKYFSWFFNLFEKRINKSCPLVYTVGPVIGNRKKLYNPIKTNISPTPINTRNGFVFAGRLESVKNIDHIIRIYATLPDKIKHKNKLFIAGDGSLRTELEELSKKIGEENNIIFTGTLTNEELIRLDSQRLILIMASSTEGLPTAIAEAFSVGVPVVSTNVGDISRVVINNINGFLFPLNYKNSDYHNAIDIILNNYAFFSSNALKASEVFNAKTVTTDVINDINNILNSKS